MSASTLIVLINVLFFLMLALGIFIGIKRGVFRSLIHLGFMISAIVIAILISGPITSGILGMKIISTPTGMITISEYILNGITAPALNNFINDLPSAVAGPIVLIVVGILMCLLFELGYVLFSKLYLNKKGLLKPANKTRFIGSLAGFAEMFLLIVLMLMPITSLSSTLQELSQPSESQSSISVSAIVNQNLPSFLLEFSEQYNQSAVGKITEMGGLNHKVYDSVAQISSGDINLSMKNDILPAIKIYDELAVDLEKCLADLDSANYDAIGENINKLIDTDFFTNAVEPLVRDVLKNKKEFLDSLNLEIDLRYALSDTFDNLLLKFEDKDFDFAGYVKTAVNDVAGLLKTLSQEKFLNDFVSFVRGSSTNALLERKQFTVLANAGKEIVAFSILEDAYPLLETALNMLPSVVRDMVDISYIYDYESAKSEVTKVFDVALALINVESVNGQSVNLIQQLINGDRNFISNIVNSDNSTLILQNMAKAYSLKGFIVNIFENIDEQVISAIRNVDTSVGINDKNFETSISFNEPDSVQEAFADRVQLQAEDLAQIAKEVYGKEISIKNGQFLDKIKEIVLKYANLEKYESESVFTSVFKNIINFFNGTVKQADGTPAFSANQRFEELVNEQFAKLDLSSYGELDPSSKYFLVSYSEILSQI